MKKYGFIGAGNMGYAILKGLVNNGNKDDVIFTDVSKDRVQWINKNLDIESISSNKDLVNSAKYIVLAIKPQYYASVLEEIKETINNSHILISIARYNY